LHCPKKSPIFAEKNRPTEQALPNLAKDSVAVQKVSKAKFAAKAKTEASQVQHKIYRTQNLIVRFLDARGKVVVDRVAKDFGMSKGQLAQTVGLSREALYKETRQKAPKTQARVREMLEIVSRVSDWAGGREQAMAWYRAEPLPAFGDRTAESLVKAGQANSVRDYLDHLAMGGFA
jgi:hypothetical protein